MAALQYLPPSHWPGQPGGSMFSLSKLHANRQCKKVHTSPFGPLPLLTRTAQQVHDYPPLWSGSGPPLSALFWLLETGSDVSSHLKTMLNNIKSSTDLTMHIVKDLSKLLSISTRDTLVGSFLVNAFVCIIPPQYSPLNTSLSSDHSVTIIPPSLQSYTSFLQSKQASAALRECN